MKKSKSIPAGYKYTFFKENIIAHHFELNSVDLKERFIEFLKKKDANWINALSSETIVRLFITTDEGLNSVHEEHQFETMMKELYPEILKYETSFGGVER